MNVAVINEAGVAKAVVVYEGRVYKVADLNPRYDVPLLTLIETGQLQALQNHLLQVDWEEMSYMDIADVQFQIPYENPQHIFGVGANYVEKAEDLQMALADKPVCFLKASDTVIGPAEKIAYPNFSQHVSAEGELALIIGKSCFEVSEERALSYVVGYTTALDLTAKDLHAENPRFLQMAKLFKGSCSFGPEIKLLDGDLAGVEVTTMQNGEVVHRNIVSNMMYSPAFIVSYISQFILLQPGDVILTGTPGSFIVNKGDVAACRVTGLQMLQNQII